MRNIILLLALLGLVAFNCFAEEQWCDKDTNICYELGDVYEDSVGDIGIVTRIDILRGKAVGARYSMRLYKEREEREAKRDAEEETKRKEFENRVLQEREIRALERIAECYRP